MSTMEVIDPEHLEAGRASTIADEQGEEVIVMNEALGLALTIGVPVIAALLVLFVASRTNSNKPVIQRLP